MNLKESKIILLYTMTGALGDFIIMSDVMRKAQLLLPQAQCLMAHRNNPHLHLWRKEENREFPFYNIYDPVQILKLILALKKFRQKGFLIFGLQMMPGSLQGFFLHQLLKELGALHYIVDFNLINADIITGVEGGYIFDCHLNQLKSVFKLDIPVEYYQLRLPCELFVMGKPKQNLKIGIHPWTRRGKLENFVWSDDNWLNLIQTLLKQESNELIIFGKDQLFDSFKNFVVQNLNDPTPPIVFKQSDSVLELIETVAGLDMLISVNSSVVHIGHALNKKMVVLSGPNFMPWVPKGPNIKTVLDLQAVFPGSDKCTQDLNFPSNKRITLDQVLDGIKSLI